MTATKAAPSTPYVSQLCVHGRHDPCRGVWGTTLCGCTCHQEPPPEPVPVLFAAVELPPPVAHCPTCRCNAPV